MTRRELMKLACAAGAAVLTALSTALSILHIGWRPKLSTQQQSEHEREWQRVRCAVGDCRQQFGRLPQRLRASLPAYRRLSNGAVPESLFASFWTDSGSKYICITSDRSLPDGTYYLGDLMSLHGLPASIGLGAYWTPETEAFFA